MGGKRCGGGISKAGLAGNARAISPVIASCLIFLGAISSGATAYDGEEWFTFGARDRPAVGQATQSGGDLDPKWAGRGDAPLDPALAKQWETSPPRGLPTLSKENTGPLVLAVQRYAQIAANGGWPVLPMAEVAPGASHAVVITARRRLEIEGDLQPGQVYEPQVLDSGLVHALMRFQVRHGLTPNGHLNRRTIAAMNVPAAARLHQLKVNLDRLKALSSTTPRRYVVVNIPAAQIEAVDGDHVVSRHSAVVGKIDRQTPVLRSAITELNFNPVWHLPPTVIERDLIPKGREMAHTGKGVLAKFGIDAVDATGRKLEPERIDWSAPATHTLSFRQNPGPDNPLGFVKITFDNSFSVYMHDSPSQSLFGANFRAASSGCVRVQNVQQLATWLLEGTQGWNASRVAAMRATGERRDVKLNTPTPLYFAYVTAWATQDGMVHFRRDLYQKDGIGLLAAAY